MEPAVAVNFVIIVVAAITFLIRTRQVIQHIPLENADRADDVQA